MIDEGLWGLQTEFTPPGNSQYFRFSISTWYSNPRLVTTAKDYQSNLCVCALFLISSLILWANVERTSTLLQFPNQIWTQYESPRACGRSISGLKNTSLVKSQETSPGFAPIKWVAKWRQPWKQHKWMHVNLQPWNIEMKEWKISHLVGCFEKWYVTLRLQLAFDFIPVSLFVLKQDPGGEQWNEKNYEFDISPWTPESLADWTTNQAPFSCVSQSGNSMHSQQLSVITPGTETEQSHWVRNRNTPEPLGQEQKHTEQPLGQEQKHTGAIGPGTETHRQPLGQEHKHTRVIGPGTETHWSHCARNRNTSEPLGQEQKHTGAIGPGTETHPSHWARNRNTTEPLCQEQKHTGAIGPGTETHRGHWARNRNTPESLGQEQKHTGAIVPGTETHRGHWARNRNTPESLGQEQKHTGAIGPGTETHPSHWARNRNTPEPLGQEQKHTGAIGPGAQSGLEHSILTQTWGKSAVSRQLFCFNVLSSSSCSAQSTHSIQTAGLCSGMSPLLTL